MNEPLDIPRLLELRRLTRSVSEQIQSELTRHINTLSPLLSPLPILGDHIRGGPKTPVKGAEQAYKSLMTKFKAVATAKPYSLVTDIQSPLDLFSATPSLTPVQYAYCAEGDTKTADITITAPLRWVLSYPDVSPQIIRDLLVKNRNQVKDELQHCLLQTLTLELILDQQPGLVSILKGLRFSIESTQNEVLGELPTLIVSCPIKTCRPPDEIILQNTEISGVPSFEEVIDIEDIRKMEDPFKANILAITEQNSPVIYKDLTE